MPDTVRTDAGSIPEPINTRAPSTVLGRGGEYIFRGELAQGGMATVHLGSIRGAIGFVRAVAIKRLHAHYAKNEAFVSMLVDEARLVSRIRHANVVPILDVVSQNDELYLIMDFVHGVPLNKLIDRGEDGRKMPTSVAASIMAATLSGLHAAHEARDDKGQALAIVHRDVSPQNIMVGVDGTARVLDFGVAKARGRLSYTDDGVVKGKLGYMSPEQLRGKPLDRRTDVYAAGVVLWECIVGGRLIDEGEDGRAVLKALETEIRPPSELTSCPPALEAVVMRALDPNPARRYQSALEMANELEASVPLATTSEVGAWVATAGKKWIDRQSQLLELLDARAVEEESGEVAMRAEAVFTPQSQRAHSVVTLLGKHLPPKKNRRVVWLAAGTVLLALAVLLVLSVRKTQSVTDKFASKSAKTAGHEIVITPTPTTVTPKAEATTPEVAPPAPTIAASIPPVPKKKRVVRKPQKPADKAVAAPDPCNPPYTINAQGIRKYKPQCF
jgi:eukaryotic-like serine/threonine-protein kinase